MPAAFFVWLLAFSWRPFFSYLFRNALALISLLWLAFPSAPCGLASWPRPALGSGTKALAPFCSFAARLYFARDRRFQITAGSFVILCPALCSEPTALLDRALFTTTDRKIYRFLFSFSHGRALQLGAVFLRCA